MAEPSLTFRNVNDFVAWERQQADRWEWYGGAPVAMTGASSAHNLICGNLCAALRDALRHRGCKAYSESMKVMIAGTLLYPDVVATCARIGDQDDVAREPIIVIEIVSPSSSSYDRNAKRALYRLIPTLEHYILVSQTRASIEVDTRTEDGWATAHVIGLGAGIALTRSSIEVSMADVYRDAELAAEGG